MKPFTNKHSIAAGSPVHMGGSGKSPLYQDDLKGGLIQDMNSQDTNAAVYKTPAIDGYDHDRFWVVRDMNDNPNYESPYTDEQLAERVDMRDGEAIPYNYTHGTVEIQGSDNPYGLRKRKSINLEDAQLNNSSREAIVQRAQRNSEVPITNQEMSTNRWSSSTRENYPRQTRFSPQQTAKKQDLNFMRNRRRDSLHTTNERNLAAMNVNLNEQGQYLSRFPINEDEANRFINSIK
jgi:hypothetical protein